ncbi:uncharacterized protein LY89DRAFT_741301 [Mollisia scopiformis]|uniref:Nephrocystin 3-like N-terminal domain-containing protein n=1 Tax=Mollisia scopiformis TaxID=149040 RepID=A0A132B9C0_MOLSC|nr:uncharacterized protein LY89DRAFT_741301 [Mollisia scopiformis]KUJ09002.1 hypothetical protein LY89DRAFT_741301 [Mollisia scopiformis]
MLDPVSAIGVAAAVIQFVEFGGHLLSDAYEIYTSPSGQKAEHVTNATLTKDMGQLARQVDQKSRSLSQHGQQSDSEAQLLKLCGECKNISNDLLAALGILRLRGTSSFSFNRSEISRSFKVALRGMWSEKKIDKMGKELIRIKQQMMMAILVCVWDDSKRSQELFVGFSKRLDEIITTLDRNDPTEDKILSAEIISVANAKTNPILTELLQILWDPNWDLSATLTLPTPGNEEKCRREWSSFPAWLVSESKQIYWITGRPGSGKSTLTKFIIKDKFTIGKLKTWADGLELVIITFYSWNAGLDLQKSCEGLVRTLIYQTLLRCPNLTPIVAPRRWTLFKTLRSTMTSPRWTLTEITESFTSLLSECGKSIKLALIIDGLDEFESPPNQILELIKKTNAHQGVKLCLASRPWIEFEEAFSHCPMLRMERLTKEDIEFFTRNELELNRGFKSLKEAFPEESDQLLQDIVGKAQGIFLWVSLVVHALLEGLTEGDKLADLQETVRGLPSDISSLYSHIWSKVRSRNMANSSQIFRLFKSAMGPIDYLTLWLADEMKGLDTDMNSMSVDLKTELKGLMKRRLDSRTRGILEISPDEHAPDFDPYTALLQAEAIRLSDKATYFKPSWEYYEFWIKVLKCLAYASRVDSSPANGPKLVQILDKIDVEGAEVSINYDSIFRWLPVLHLKSTPHWSVTQGPASRENSFVGFVSQFCITPYINAKILAGRRLNQFDSSSEKSISILENAVLGPGQSTNQKIVRKISEESSLEVLHIDTTRRLEFVKFLLANGATVRFNDEILMKMKAHSKGVRTDEKKYIDAVSKLPKNSAGGKGLLKSAMNVFRRGPSHK